MTSIRLFALIACTLACATAGREQPSDGSLPSDDAPEDANLEADANNCAMQPCTILPQCGCTEDAACDIDGDDLNGGACRSVVGTAASEGQACSNPSGCQAGLVCLASGVCKKYCDGNDDCQQPRGQCLIEIQNAGAPVPNVPLVCSSGCDPTNNAAANGCPAGKKCGMFVVTRNAVDIDITECTGAGNLAQGGDCTGGGGGNDALCAVDHSCTTTNGTNFNCRRVCQVGGPAVCGGLACIGFNPAINIGGAEYGVCN
jgi:hypothetical protein